jgi:hypothetical protein
MQQLYLTRRNLLVLLAKLDRCKRDGPEASARTIIKQDTVHKKYPCTDVISVTAVEDEDYYDRLPGTMWPEDVPNSKQGGI